MALATIIPAVVVSCFNANDVVKIPLAVADAEQGLPRLRGRYGDVPAHTTDTVCLCLSDIVSFRSILAQARETIVLRLSVDPRIPPGYSHLFAPAEIMSGAKFFPPIPLIVTSHLLSMLQSGG